MATTLVEKIEKTVQEQAAEDVLMKGAMIDVGSYTIKRDQTGLVITVKSPKLEGFFQTLAGGSRLQETGDGKKYYKLPSGDIASQLQMSSEDLDISFHQLEQGLFEGSRINLGFLRAVGIKDGMELKFPGVYPRPQMAKLSKAMKYAMNKIYSNYIKEFEVGCDIIAIERYRVDGVQA